MATQQLLGLGVAFMRMVLLKPNQDAEASEKALVGNTVLVAKPSPEAIAAELPPTEEQQASYFNVVYANASMNLGNKKALSVDKQEYLDI